MNAKPKTELNRCVFVQKRNSVNGVLDCVIRKGVLKMNFYVTCVR